MGEIANAWLLGLTALGFAIGGSVVLTAPAAISWRLTAAAIVLVASLFVLAAVFAGLVRPPIGLIAEVLAPALVALGLRRLGSRRSR